MEAFVRPAGGVRVYLSSYGGGGGGGDGGDGSKQMEGSRGCLSISADLEMRQKLMLFLEQSCTILSPGSEASEVSSHNSRLPSKNLITQHQSSKFIRDK